MTVDSQYSPDTYTGDGAVLTFAYTFRVLQESDLKVQIKDVNGDYTTQVLTTNYTIDEVGGQSGGNITFVEDEEPSATDTVIISRNIPIVQGTNYVENAVFPAETHEETVDELTMICQQLGNQIDRSVRAEITVSSSFDGSFTPAADEFLVCTSDGLGITTSAAAGGGITASSTDTLTNKTINTASNTITIVEADISDLGTYLTAGSTATLTNKTFNANGTGNSLSNVDVADLAVGTDGELITWDSSGNPTTVATGTNNYVLTSNGAGSAPTFQAATGGGDMVLADVQTITGAKTFNSTKLICAGSTSGTTTVNATAVAGTTTLTLPAATDTLVGKDTTDTLTNKTINTASNTITVVEADISDLGAYITDITGDNLSALADVTITSIASNEILKWNGSAWINNTIAEAGLAAASHTHATTDITSGTFANARIAEANVTQHEAALSITESQISDLQTYATASSTTTFTNKTFDANATGNSLSNVDIADLANGTDGELITWDAAGAPAAVAVGTSGHVLTSNGVGAAPTFQAAGAGDMILANAQSVTGAKTFDPSTLLVDGATSGTTTINATAVAGTTTVTLPAATDTLVGKATTDTLTNKTIDANGTGNSISNIDIADLANGTDGELITWDASGVPAAVAVGTATHVLTSNGVGAAPTFQAAAAGGGGDVTLIASVTASSSTTVDFDNVFTSTYSRYILTVDNLTPASNETELQCRVGTGATPTYQSGTTDYGWCNQYFNTAAGGTQDQSDSEWHINGIQTLGTAGGENCSLEVHISDPSATAEYTLMRANGMFENSGGNLEVWHSAGIYNATTAVTSIQFFMNSGNLATGDFRLYGLSDT